MTVRRGAALVASQVLEGLQRLEAEVLPGQAATYPQQVSLPDVADHEDLERLLGAGFEDGFMTALAHVREVVKSVLDSVYSLEVGSGADEEA